VAVALHSSDWGTLAGLTVISDITLILGGARSGKSRYAEQVLRRHAAPWVYVADHQVRRGDGWHTVEAPLALGEALDRAAGRPVLVDCLTLWLTNVMLGAHDVEAAVSALEAALGRRDAATVLVSNEVGFGIVPETALGRSFRDEAGRLNQRMAAVAGHVAFVIAGLPMALK
jgi:adenosyl cobinamide kinase/adenosyl cobinamide phosphate guanylyltransferase